MTRTQRQQLRLPKLPIFRTGCRIVCALASLVFLTAAPAVFAATLGETPEVVYSGTDAQVLRDRATALGSVVTIYEHLHNTIEFSAYHGSRSGSVNTYLGQRGSDVDIATTLIAMLRSQNIPARYAVGTVRIPATQLTNWLGVGNLDVAVQNLKDHGIQGVILASDRSSVDFEHAWAEAFVPFDQYRGINAVTPAVDCSQTASATRCTWVSLDASFKQKVYNGLNLDPYNGVTFDYNGYYRAILDATTDPLKRKDKNPLTILEDQIGAWLRANHPGKTLEDVEDAGKIVELRDGLLPASLPYQVVGNVRRYDTVAAHDAAVSSLEPKKWGKTVKVGVQFNAGSSSYQVDGPPLLLAAISTKSLGLSTEFVGAGNAPNMILRLNGQEIYRPITETTVSGFVPTLGHPLTIQLSMDSSPGAVAGFPDLTISAGYTGIVGGYYLIATGGESSNWSQVHRAADTLLADGDIYEHFYSPVYNLGEAGCQPDGVGCTPYEDENGNGWDPSDPKLIENSLAMEILSGGLMNVAATQYYAKLRHQIERSDRLMKTKAPILGFLGVISSVHEVEYVDGTAFSIMPGGLLIDMKGITLGGTYRANEASANHSNRQFEFVGHLVSSLEHEIWQELTGYDAVSTVRGIQMALANGATLLNPKKNSTTDTLPSFYNGVGFTASVPAGFSYVPYTVFATAPATWAHATSGSAFEAFQASIDISTPALRLDTRRYTYSPTNGLYGRTKCVADQVALLNSYPNGPYTVTTCSGATFYGSKADALSFIGSDWSNTVIPNLIGQGTFDYFDRNKGFVPASNVYRAHPAAFDAQDIESILGIRDDLSYRDLSQAWIEYLIPSKLTTTPFNSFSVSIRKGYGTASGRLISMSMSITNFGQGN